MGEIDAITFAIGNDTYQIVNGRLLIWKGIPDHEPDHEINMEDIKRIITAASFLRKESDK